ncbi:MAG: hypothetical protein ABSE71_04920, partial [Candidatus Micrarchaeaceae archaeon]
QQRYRYDYVVPVMLVIVYVGYHQNQSKYALPERNDLTPHIILDCNIYILQRFKTPAFKQVVKATAPIIQKYI